MRSYYARRRPAMLTFCCVSCDCTTSNDFPVRGCATGSVRGCATGSVRGCATGSAHIVLQKLGQLMCAPPLLC